MLGELFKRPKHLIQQSVERVLKQMLKPFKQAFIRFLLYKVQK